MNTLLLLAGPIGAGVAGSFLFTVLRFLFPAPATAPAQPRYVLYWLIWSPRGARITAMALSALIMILASLVVALRGQEDVGGALLAAIDQAVAASGVSQLVHLPQLSADGRTTEA